MGNSSELAADLAALVGKEQLHLDTRQEVATEWKRVPLLVLVLRPSGTVPALKSLLLVPKRAKHPLASAWLRGGVV